MQPAIGQTARALDAGQKAGQQLVENLSAYFDDGVRPPNFPADQWAAARKETETQAHTILACIAQTKMDDATAEAEYKKVLTIDPTQASASYSLASTVLREVAKSKDVTRYSEALYDFARSVGVTGPNALSAAGRPAAEAYLSKVYTAYHGSVEGLDVLKAMAASGPALPPSGFHIRSVGE